MAYEFLPPGPTPEPLSFTHFPDRVSCFIFRNWNMIPVATMAKLLGTTSAKILRIAKFMGLPKYEAGQTKFWKTRGYISLIRQNWHLLPYEQILEMLDMSEKELAFCLKEDDFLYHKLGTLKPAAKVLKYEEPSEETIARLKEIKNELCADLVKESKNFAPFDFKKCARVAPAKTKNLRMIYPYSASYGDPLMDDKLSDFSDEMLKDYARAGINGLWFQAVLYGLVPWDRAPEMSGNYERRVKNLRRLTDRAAKYGVGIYLYFNEPRTIMMEWADKFKDLEGATDKENTLCLCTSKKPVLDYLENAMATLFAQCPNLAGIFTITRSENATNCAYSTDEHKNSCPICKDRLTSDIVAEVLTALANGIGRSNPKARVMAHTWAWGFDYINDIIRKVPKNVSILSVSEWGVETDCEGYKGSVVDYSISKPGPSPRAKENFIVAKECGLGRVAKVQINNSWEMSAVPYMPVFDLVEKHLNDLRNVGVNDFMLSWTLGGAPSPMVGLLSKSKEEIYKELYGEAAGAVAEASKIFSDAFTHFPFDSAYCIYKAPMNYGPMNLLWLDPTNYNASMVGFPYDDITTWRYRYPEDVFARAFHRVADNWEKGLPVMEKMLDKLTGKYKKNFEELYRFALVTYCHFKTTSNAIDFVMLRRDMKANKDKLISILENELVLAKCVGMCQCEDARVAFEASNHYYYTPSLIQEKIINCKALLRRLNAL